MFVTDWMPIGEIDGQTLFGRCTHYDELGTPSCNFEIRSDRETVYALVRSDQYPHRVYVEDGNPDSSYQPAYRFEGDDPERIAVIQGWRIAPRYLADGRPWIYKTGGSDASKGRPPKPDFSAPGAVEALDRLTRAFRASHPTRLPTVDLYRMCEGDNPSLLRAE